MSSDTAIACRSKSTYRPVEVDRWVCHGRSLARAAAAELGMNAGGEPHQFAAVETTGKRIGERTVDPVEGREIATLGKTECGIGEPRLLAHIKRQPPSSGILVHELRGGLPTVGQQPSTHQFPPLGAKFGGAHL